MVQGQELIIQGQKILHKFFYPHAFPTKFWMKIMLKIIAQNYCNVKNFIIHCLALNFNVFINFIIHINMITLNSCTTYFITTLHGLNI